MRSTRRPIIGLRDRALVGFVAYSFARIGAAMGMGVDDVYTRDRRLWLCLQRRRAASNTLCRHNLAAYLHEYIDGAGLANDPKAVDMYQDRHCQKHTEPAHDLFTLQAEQKHKRQHQRRKGSDRQWPEQSLLHNNELL